MRFARIALVIVALVCFGVALSYPIRYRLAQRSNEGNMQALSDMRARVQASSGAKEAPSAAETAETAAPPGATEGPEAAGTAGSPETTEAPRAAEATKAVEVPETVEVPEAPETVGMATRADAPDEAADEASAEPGAEEAPGETAEATATAAVVTAAEKTSAPGGAAMSSAIQAAIASGKAAMTEASVEAPVEASEAPAETAEVPVEATEAPAETVEAPAETVEAPVEALETPAEAAEAQVNVDPQAPVAELSDQKDEVSATEPSDQKNEHTATEPPDQEDETAATEPPVQEGESAATEPPDQEDGQAATEPARAEGGVSAEVPEPAAGIAETAPRAATSAPEAVGAPPPSPDAPTATPTPEPTPTPTPGIMDLILDYEPWPTMAPLEVLATSTPDPNATPTPAPTFDIEHFTGALPYTLKEKVLLDEDAILPELAEIYALNHDLVGWIRIDDTVIDYPVVQRPEDSEFYLTHDFYGEENVNGQIILDPLCDPYTPSYNLVISGHHMKNGSMFGSLPDYYINLSRWRQHMFLEFDSLMARKQYVVFAAFYSADYDEDEEGFRYNVNVRYRMDADPWLDEIRANQLYDTGIDVKFGDEFITLTTCNRARHRNGRFVVVCRKIREGETFE